MRCLQIHRRCAIVIQRAFPPRHAHAPLVAGLQSWKTPFRMRCDQVVSIQDGEIQKFLRHLHAHRVLPHVLWTCPAIAIAIETGHRIATTTFQFRSQNIRRHTASSANSSCCHVERSERFNFSPSDPERPELLASLRMTSAHGL
jgi:hypothetical protein